MLLPLLLLAALGAGCQTAVGNYFANRGRDLGECVRLEASAALGLGVSARAAGIADLGVMAGFTLPFYRVGWRYGRPLYPTTGPDGGLDLDLNLVLWHYVLEDSIWSSGPMGGHGSRGHWCWGALPGAWSYSETKASHRTRMAAQDLALREWWDGGERGPMPVERGDHLWKPTLRLWTVDAVERDRWAHVHAFDVEATVYGGFFRVSAGFSPGEFVDFLLGWLGVDIAGDDTEWKPAKK